MNLTNSPIIKIISILFLVCVIACKSKPKDSDEKKKIPFAVNLQKPQSSYSDTLLIDKPSAVFYNPDSVQLIKIEKINEKMVFESLKHDCFYQMRNARMVLKQYWPKIKIIESSKYQYLLFKKDDNTSVCIDLNTKNDICGILLFNQKKDPLLIDMMNIDTALDFYFRK
ncbi:hypothetical protein [Emticicia sp. SJ17W-69]|uniref:hypothetical protein n=1 Tax=Emticicia sp. SJ17W-69 TaxID=3421657 RepID=UPI003EB92280